jgi:membrane dipeptidase
MFLGGTAAGAAMAGISLPSFAATAAGPNDASGIVIDGLDVSLLNEEFVGLLRKAGVHCVHKSVGTFQSIGQVYTFVDEHPDDLTIAKTAADILAAREAGKIAIVMGTQSANELEKRMTKSVGGTNAQMRTTLRSFYELGLRVQGICYQVTNIFGGGSVDDHVPLTRAGRRLVEEVHRLNMLLDVRGHTGEQTSLDAIEMSAGRPVICSHTNLKALNPNIRTISDRLCEAIAATGGVIGITAFSDFQMRNIENYAGHGPQSPQATLDDHLDQYNHVKNLVGVDHVGLGPDFVWGLTYTNTGEDSITFPPESISDGPPILTKDFENIGQLGNVIEGLRDRGWSEAELNKLMGENWWRVYRQAWGG